jgi:hypothetical protein
MKRLEQHIAGVLADFKRMRCRKTLLALAFILAQIALCAFSLWLWLAHDGFWLGPVANLTAAGVTFQQWVPRLWSLWRL